MVGDGADGGVGVGVEDGVLADDLIDGRAEGEGALFNVGSVGLERFFVFEFLFAEASFVFLNGSHAFADRSGAEAGEGELVFRADNFLLRFRLLDPPIVHDTLRPQGIEVLDLAELEKRFREAELEYTRERGITPGRETLLLVDPGGNWVEIGEIRLVQ